MKTKGIMKIYLATAIIACANINTALCATVYLNTDQTDTLNPVVTGDLYICNQIRGKATYNMNNDSLTVNNNLKIGTTSYAEGKFVQNSGTVTCKSALQLGTGSRAIGRFVQNGGTLNCESTLILAYGSVSTASFVQNNGILNCSDDINIGHGASATASFTQVDGSVNCDGSVNIGADSAKYDMSGGTLNSDTINVAYGAGGRFILSGGNVSVTNLNIASGYSSDSGTFSQSGGELTSNTCSLGSTSITLSDRNTDYFNLSGGIMNTGTLDVNNNSIFTQTDGTHTVVNNMRLDAYEGSPTYNLNGGSLHVGGDIKGTGDNGSTRIWIRGGTLTHDGSISNIYSFSIVGNGSYTADGTGVNVTTMNIGNNIETGELIIDDTTDIVRSEDILIGYNSSVIQNAGVNTISNNLSFLKYTGSPEYHLNGGTLQVNGDISENISSAGAYSSIYIDGGTLDNKSTISGIGNFKIGTVADGSYTVDGTAFQVENLEVGGTSSTGLLTIDDASIRLEVSKKLTFNQNAQLSAVDGAAIHMTGSAFENFIQDPARMNDFVNLSLIFEGGIEDLDPFEVAGRNEGGAEESWDANFAMDTITIGGEDIGRVQLVNNYDNQLGWNGIEALYVDTLILGAGSYLDLNGINLYYRTLVDNGATIDYNGGNLYQLGENISSPVPEPATLILLSLSGLALIRRKRA